MQNTMNEELVTLKKLMKKRSNYAKMRLPRDFAESIKILIDNKQTESDNQIDSTTFKNHKNITLK